MWSEGIANSSHRGTKVTEFHGGNFTTNHTNEGSVGQSVMEYKLISNENELDVVKDIWYFEFFPGVKRNSNSVFLSEYSMNAIEDIFDSIIDRYDHYGSDILDEKQLQKLECELSKRLEEIKETGKFNFLGRINDNKYYYEEEIKNLHRNEKEIIIMLEDIIRGLKTINVKKISFIGL